MGHALEACELAAAGCLAELAGVVVSGRVGALAVAVAAPVAPLVHAYSHPFGYNYGLPYGYHYGLPYNYAPAPLVYNTAPLVAPAPLPVKPVTYTHLGAHPIAPTTVPEPAL